MRTRQPTREIEMALTFRTDDLGSGASEQDGEDAEHRDNQRQTAHSTD
jgi:hypothetical protein